MIDWIWLLLAGLVAGFASGLLGVGGGIVMVPMLHYVIGIPFAEATLLSLFVIMVQAPMGVWRHHRKGAVDWQLGSWLTVGGVSGVILGRWLQPQIAVPWLKVLFAAIMGFAAYRLLAKSSEEGRARPKPVVIVTLGFIAGVLSRLLGIGGGILTVPVLALLGVPVHVAVASSLVPVWTNATFASILSLLDGLDWLVAVPLAAAALLGAPLGVKAAHALPERRLRQVVAVALGAISLLMLVTSGAW